MAQKEAAPSGFFLLLPGYVNYFVTDIL
jgi:hypothetical protein